MNQNAKGMLMASFVADSLALGVHWVYNTNVIVKKYGRVTDLIKPEMAKYHAGKSAGDFTHYGDQALWLFESVAAAGQFELERFARDWRQAMAGYGGYVDQATKATTANFEAGHNPDETGSDSTDLGGAARIAPLVYCYRNDFDALIAAAVAQTVMTHNNAVVIDSAKFFGTVAFRVLGGQPPVAAMQQAVDEIGSVEAPIASWVADGLDSAALDTEAVIKDFGQMCETEASFPATVHLIAKYQNDLEAALIENTMAGGDSSARGMVAGMVLGAFHGFDAICQRWRDGLNTYDRIMALMDQIDASNR